MSDIVVSYANEDKHPIEPLVGLLETAGCSVWWEPHNGVAAQFDEVIEREIDAAQYVIVVWSKHSIAPSWPPLVTTIKQPASGGAASG